MSIVTDGSLFVTFEARRLTTVEFDHCSTPVAASYVSLSTVLETP